MSFKTFALATAAVTALAMPAFAEIIVHEPYARASSSNSASGGSFMVIENTGAEDDRLISARSDVAERVELHTHKEDGDGIMRMVEVEEGFAVPADGKALLIRGSDHVMFFGLKESFVPGQTFNVTLEFEKAGEKEIEVVVDMDRTNDDIAHLIHDAPIKAHMAWARAASKRALGGGMFGAFENVSGQDDTIVAARTEIAQHVELHTYIEDENGVAQMVEREGGYPIPAGETFRLERGGDHIMLFGLQKEFVNGDTFVMTLEMDSGAEVDVDVVVDMERTNDDIEKMLKMDHSAHGHMNH